MLGGAPSPGLPVTHHRDPGLFLPRLSLLSVSLSLPAAQNVNLKFQTLDLTGPSLPLHSGCGLLLLEGVLL